MLRIPSCSGLLVQISVDCRYSPYLGPEDVLSILISSKRIDGRHVTYIIRRANQLVVADAPQLVDVLKCHGKDMANKQRV